MKTKKTQLELFISKINISTDCWLWTGSTCRRGYGMVRFFGKTTKAHRLSWIIFRGKIPQNMYVLHRCDVRNCVNPSHLFIGNQQDNMDDMWSKGRDGNRARFGRKNPMARLTEMQVKGIRRRAGYKTTSQLAKDYKVSESTIHRVIKGESWSHIS